MCNNKVIKMLADDVNEMQLQLTVRIKVDKKKIQWESRKGIYS